ncbi:MAG: glycosyltransferase family 39 protein [Anaerolineae bacterium]|nr:glycosyltransferase family 39 protein [Anaerolineae bacterium]
MQESRIMNHESAFHVSRFTFRVFCLILFLIAFAQVILAARRTSITLDEPLHIASGYACLVTGDYRLVEEHPPLVKLWQTLPLLWAQPALRDPRTSAGWENGDLAVVARDVVVAYRPIEPLVFAARVPNMLLLVLLAALVCRWSADLFGRRAGLLALFLTVSDPNLLAHAGVAATDLGATCATFAAMFTFWRWRYDARGPSWRRMLLAAVVLGLALGVKSTALLLLPVFGLLLLLPRRDESPFARFGQAAVACGVAFVVLWGFYRFEIGPAPGIPFPIPMPSHLLPLLRLRAHMQWGHAAFLMGKNLHYGDWRYFPIAFVLKTPPLTLGLLAVALVQAVRERMADGELAGRRIMNHESWIGRSRFTLHVSRFITSCILSPVSLFPILYFAASLTSSLNIGYRHLLPVLPFVYVGIGRIGKSAGGRVSGSADRRVSESANGELRIRNYESRITRRVLRFMLYALLLGYALTTLYLFPWHLAYFNIFAGGPDGGYRYLVDSNLDWGQTWKELRHYLDESGIAAFGLSQYTINDPHAYGLDYTPLPPWPDAPPVLPQRFAPPPGIYAISSTQLQGVVVADPEMFDYFRRLEPRARIGHAMFVYEVPARPAAGWVAQCFVPVAPLSTEALFAGLGRSDLELFTFDCTQSWLIPPGNGWYVASRDATLLPEVRSARLAYEQKQTGTAPPFAVYEWFNVSPLAGIVTGTVYAAPSALPPLQVMEGGVSLSTPAILSNTLRFLGYTLNPATAQPGQSLVLQTYWEVLNLPAQPLSLMAHLLNADGVPAAVGDGLGVPLDQWRTGQVIVQRHVWDIPPETPPGTYWMQTGAYCFPDLQRLPVLDGATVVGERLILGAVEVRRP